MAEFDKYGRLKNTNYRPQPLSSFTSTYAPSSSSYERPNIWNRFNIFISNVGEWLQNNTKALSNNIAIGAFFIACAITIIGAISVWIDEGFWSFVIYSFIGYIVMYYGGLLITGIMMYVLRIPIFILGLIFHNAYVLLITITIALGSFFFYY